MSSQIAAYFKEKSHVSESINQKIVCLAYLATESFSKANMSSDNFVSFKLYPQNCMSWFVRFKQLLLPFVLTNGL